MHHVRICFAIAAMALLAGCSDSPPPTARRPEPPPAPVTGRQAFQYLYGSSRIWAPDSMPLTIRSLHAPGVTSGKGTAGAWEVVFVSPTNARARTYTWSAVEAEGLHKGVFPGPQETWHAGGPNQPFSPALLKVDTPEALDAATQIRRQRRLSEQTGPASDRGLSARFRSRDAFPESGLARAVGRYAVVGRVLGYGRCKHRQNGGPRLSYASPHHIRNDTRSVSSVLPASRLRRNRAG